MGILIQEADWSRDLGPMVDLWKGTRTHSEESFPFRERAEWLYLKNPAGIATGWVAEDDRTGQAVGFTVGLPRRMKVLGREVRGWNCGDFSIHIKFRILGVATKLRRAAKEGVEAGKVAFLYAHPNERMQVIHEQVGHRPIGTMGRLARPLSIRSKVEARVGKGWIGRTVARGGDLLLGVRGPRRVETPGCEMELRPGRDFGIEFDALYEQVSPRYPVSGIRDHRYLDWRYGQNPVQTFETVCLRKTGGRLAGWLIFSVGSDRFAKVTDFLYEEPAGLRGMLLFLAGELRRRRVETLSCIGFRGSPYIGDLERSGLRPRDDADSTVFAHAPPESEVAKAVLDGSAWYMTVGDRDV